MLDKKGAYHWIYVRRLSNVLHIVKPENLRLSTIIGSLWKSATVYGKTWPNSARVKRPKLLARRGWKNMPGFRLAIKKMMEIRLIIGLQVIW